MAQKGLWNFAREKILRRKRSVAEGRNFLSSWLREDGREKEERSVEKSDENEEERVEKVRREG